MLKTRFESRGRSVGNKKNQTISIFCKEINKDLTTTTKFVPLSVATKQRRIKREMKVANLHIYPTKSTFLIITKSHHNILTKRLCKTKLVQFKKTKTS